MAAQMKAWVLLFGLAGSIFGDVCLCEPGHAEKPILANVPLPRHSGFAPNLGLSPKRVLCGYGIDVDAVSGWINTAGSDVPLEITDVSRGIWGGTVGVDRMLSLLDKYNIKASFFVPGHTLESFPDSIAKVRDAGHEIGLHGYTHEFVSTLTEEDERAIMKKTVELITEFTGKYPRGYTAPSWSVSNRTIHLLESFGLLYDHSFHHHDCQPYQLPYNPWYVETNASLRAKDWMHPMSKLRLSSIIEIPGNWNLDDWLPLNYGVGSQGYVDPDVILKTWKAQFDYCYREYDTFIFPISIHPDVSGKAHVQLMHERFIEYVNSHEGVEWMSFEEMAQEFKSGNVKGYTFTAGVGG